MSDQYRPVASPRGAGARKRIRDAAMALFAQRAFAEVTVKDIAREAGVFPNQITHHYGSKDALYITAAFGLLLRESDRLRTGGRRASGPDLFKRELARTALAMPSLPAVVGTLSVARANPAVRPELRSAMSVFFRQSDRYLERVLEERGWAVSHGVEAAVRTFWGEVFGAVLMRQAGFDGGPGEHDIASAVEIREVQAASRPAR
ncbi:MAG: TetR family transcriptional regulator [Acidipropionibacterium sp.]|nr:TetR family transcriptional regulator [Acidipropionibacterium sp.]